jgi:hypothetical protein
MASIAIDLAKNIAQKVATSPLRDSAIAFGKKLLVSTEHEFDSTAAGRSLKDIHLNDYLPMYNKLVTDMTQTEKVKMAAGQPSLAPDVIHSKAQRQARSESYGHHDALIATYVKSIEKEPNLNPLQKRIKQQNLADHMAMLLKDTKDYTNKKTGAITTESSVKHNITLNSENAVSLKTKAVYHPPTDLEKALHGYANLFLAPLIAIPHLGTGFNYMLRAPMQDIAGGMKDMFSDSANVKQFATDLGLFKGTALDAYAVRYNGRKGILANSINPEFGETVARIMHQPGFNPSREWTVALGAATGKRSADRAAQNFFESNGSHRAAEYQLKLMGIDPKTVLKQGGKLTKEQTDSAIFKFVDDSVFLDPSFHRSYYSSSNAPMRIGLMYHGYITRQAKLMLQTLKGIGTRTKAGDYGMAAQMMGTLGVVFPAVGLGLKTMESWGRGQFQESLDWTDESIPEIMLDGYLHMGAFGVAADYTQSVSRHVLSNAFLGPLGNVATQGIQDAGYPLIREFQGKDGDPEPLERDVLDYGLPDNLGKILANQFLPNKKQRKSRGID